MRHVVDLWPWKTRSILHHSSAISLIAGRQIGRTRVIGLPVPFDAQPWAEFFSQWTWSQWSQWAMKGRRRG